MVIMKHLCAHALEHLESPERPCGVLFITLWQLGWACEVPWAGKTRPVIAPSMPLDVEQAVADELQRVRNDVPNMGRVVDEMHVGHDGD